MVYMEFRGFSNAIEGIGIRTLHGGLQDRRRGTWLEFDSDGDGCPGYSTYSFNVQVGIYIYKFISTYAFFLNYPHHPSLSCNPSRLLSMITRTCKYIHWDIHHDPHRLANYRARQPVT